MEVESKILMAIVPILRTVCSIPYSISVWYHFSPAGTEGRGKQVVDDSCLSAPEGAVNLVEQFSDWYDEEKAGKWQLLSSEHGLSGPVLALCPH